MNIVVRLLISEEAEHDFCRLVALSNALQFFYRVDQEVVRVQTPGMRVDGISPTALDLMRLLEEKNLIGPRYPNTHYVLLTDKHVSGPSGVAVHSVAPEVTVLSNFLSTRTNNGDIVLLARRILQVGMKALIGSKCTDAGCVCGGGQDFLFLCEGCECELRIRGFRDAIRHLKDSINWLNQRHGAHHPTLSYPERESRDGKLALVSRYARQIAAAREQPFRDKLILMVLHFLRDVVPFVEALTVLGADYKNMVLVAKPYPYPNRDQISHAIQMLGVNVQRASKASSVEDCATQALDQIASNDSIANKSIVVIEDGGYFGPLLHKPKYSALLNRCVGIVEQTTKGIRQDLDIPDVRVPILSVAGSKFKALYESPEIGRITIQNIGRFVPNVKLSGAYAVMFGFGSIGEQVAYHLNRAFNMGVSVVEPDDLALMRAGNRKDIVIEAKRSFAELEFGQRAILVVGTTGKLSIGKDVLEKLRDGSILVSTSSDQVEIDVGALRGMAQGNEIEIEDGVIEYTMIGEGGEKRLLLLAEGYPINFYGSESLPNDTIDPVLTLLILSAVEICREGGLARGIDKELVNKIADRYELVKGVIQGSEWPRESSPARLISCARAGV